MPVFEAPSPSPGGDALSLCLLPPTPSIARRSAKRTMSFSDRPLCSRYFCTDPRAGDEPLERELLERELLVDLDLAVLPLLRGISSPLVKCEVKSELQK